MIINEQPILLTKRKINCLCYKCTKFFAKNGQSNLVVVLVLVLESKGPKNVTADMLSWLSVG